MRNVVLSVLLVIMLTPVAFGQATSSITGVVTDPSGGVVPGATVTISSSVLPGGSTNGVTDAGGVYRFPSLPPGIYQVKVELGGFKTLVREGIDVLVGQTTPLDFPMKVAAVSETVTVAGTSPTVDTTSANVNVNLSNELLQGTPG